MNWIKITLFLLFPLCSFTQGENPYANGIGINLVQGIRSGLGISFRYKRQIRNKGIAKFELKTNAKSSYGGRIGYEPFQLHWKKLELGLGLDLQFEYNDFSMYGQPNTSEWTLELPIELRYNVSSEYSISAGISLSHLLKSGNFSCSSCHQTIAEIRMGVGYKF